MWIWLRVEERRGHTMVGIWRFGPGPRAFCDLRAHGREEAAATGKKNEVATGKIDDRVGEEKGEKKRKYKLLTDK